MSGSLDSLLRPFAHKSLNLRNRVAMAPMTRTFSPGYVPNDQVVGYYQRRAEGEVRARIAFSFRGRSARRRTFSASGADFVSSSPS